MTSGPMRAGALPPDRQPDPQVVAWMRDYLRDHPHAGLKELPRVFIGEELDPNGEFTAKNSPTLAGPLLPESWAILKASAVAAKGPLTVADIPAGQGAASLLREGSSIFYKERDGSLTCVHTFGGPVGSEAYCAFTDHLAATLPTIDTEDVDLTPLFDTPQIHTDTDGRHWDDTGREHRAVDVGGEVTYQPTDTTEEST